mmetsp:Transcript_7171/g.12448  ORF Transcript_7171/g.12448 Transcript_7171/m.12448 type:complete len:147 (-) Transcript_7171:51-491(-)
MQLLVESGASLEARDGRGRTAIDLGREQHRRLTKPRPRLPSDAGDYTEDARSHIIQPQPPQLATYKVVHSSRVAIRSAPAADAKPVGLKMPGERFVAVEEAPGWVKLTGVPGDQWVRIDGKELGLGKLLERIDLSEAFATPSEDEN